MKLISLNTWGGRKFSPLMDFIKQHRQSTDIFCFQEIFQNDQGFETLRDGYRANLFQDLKSVLGEHNGYFAPVMKHYDFSGDDLKGRVKYDLLYGLAVFTNKEIIVDKVWDEMIYRERFAEPGDGLKNQQKNIQVIRFKASGKDYSIFNFHGIWYPGDKLDTPRRIAQSKKVKALLKKEKNRKILIGDFNLYPETESLKILEDGMVNLIKTFHIKTTRVQDLKKHGRIQYWADYALVSPEINVKKFEVPQIEISDHLPLIMEFD